MAGAAAGCKLAHGVPKCLACIFKLPLGRTQLERLCIRVVTVSPVNRSIRKPPPIKNSCMVSPCLSRIFKLRTAAHSLYALGHVYSQSISNRETVDTKSILQMHPHQACSSRPAASKRTWQPSTDERCLKKHCKSSAGPTDLLLEAGLLGLGGGREARALGLQRLQRRAHVALLLRDRRCQTRGLLLRCLALCSEVNTSDLMPHWLLILLIVQSDHH